MIRFRPKTLDDPPGDIADLFAVGQLIDDAIRPGHFFVSPDLDLTWIPARAETIPWEIFRGRALDASQTRLQKSFLSWSVVQAGANEPLISVKLDVHTREIHVTRGLLVYAWEACDSDGGIDTREAVKWQRELVGTIALADFADLESVRDELICLIWQAIVGTSRLPLTSVEAPLPAYVFGQMHYVYRSDAPDRPMTSWAELLPFGTGPTVEWQELVKAVEFTLRLSDKNPMHFLEALGRMDWGGVENRLGRNRSALCPKGSDAHPIIGLWQAMFNGVSLSPYTHFVHRALISIALGAPLEERLFFYSHLLRQLGRHLTAYDLVTFHHRGANYPDALLLDKALKYFVESAETFPDYFLANDPKARMRRRALRQACLLRRSYEGHLVPDQPTSPGENARVLPASHPRVPEEQLLQPLQRRRTLYADDPLAQRLTPLARQVLEKSVRDLEHLDERVEMGLGVFIDRPLGYGKAIGEPDLTPLLAHEAFSPSQARRRWRDLKAWCAELAIPMDAAPLDALFENGPWPVGLPHGELAECPRPTAALSDVRKVASDFVILRTMPGGLQNMLKLLPEIALEWPPRLCVPVADDAGRPCVAIYDAALGGRLRFAVDASQGFITRAGIELPRAGVKVLSEPKQGGSSE